MDKEILDKIENQKIDLKESLYAILSEYFNLRDNYCDPDEQCANCKNLLNESFLVTESCKCWIESIDKIYNKLRDYELNVEEKDLLNLVDDLKEENYKYKRANEMQLDTIKQLSDSNNYTNVANENQKITIDNQQEEIYNLKERLEVKIKECEKLKQDINYMYDTNNDKDDIINELEVKIEQLTNKLNIIVKTCEL